MPLKKTLLRMKVWLKEFVSYMKKSQNLFFEHNFNKLGEIANPIVTGHKVA